MRVEHAAFHAAALGSGAFRMLEALFQCPADDDAWKSAAKVSNYTFGKLRPMLTGTCPLQLPPLVVCDGVPKLVPPAQLVTSLAYIGATLGGDVKVEARAAGHERERRGFSRYLIALHADIDEYEPIDQYKVRRIADGAVIPMSEIRAAARTTAVISGDPNEALKGCEGDTQ